MLPFIKRHYTGPAGIREILPIALPMMVSSACDTVMIFTNRLFLAKIDSIQMSAAMGGGISFFLLLTFFIGLTGYSAALVAQHLGAGEEKNVRWLLLKRRLSLFVHILFYWPESRLPIKSLPSPAFRPSNWRTKKCISTLWPPFAFSRFCEMY